MKTIEQVKKDMVTQSYRSLSAFRATIIYLESQPSEEFIFKQLEFNRKRIKSMESEIQSMLQYDRTLVEKDVRNSKQFKPEFEKIKKQNEILNYILG